MDFLTKKLKDFFYYDKFRENQREIIEAILEGKDVLGIMPTGLGKSLCYQLPAVIQNKLVVVVSPLIALMKNQVDSLQRKGIAAAYLNSSINKKELEELKKAMREKKLKLLYISPETLSKPSTLTWLSSHPIAFIAIDEAHCISEWGHHFRPEYRKIKEAIDQLGRLPIMALTATATERIQRDIIKNLAIEKASKFFFSFDRSNLYYEVTAKKQAEKKIIAFLQKNTNDSGIIYCHSRKKVEELTAFLKINGIHAVGYHAGLDIKLRKKNQEAFIGNEIRVIVATIAFGMGIDKPNVRFVLHYDGPKSLEGYYQQTGRAGRDGSPGKCIFYFDPNELTRIKWLNYNKSSLERKVANALLTEVQDYALSSLCRRKQLLHYFGEEHSGQCNACDNCQSTNKTIATKGLYEPILSIIAQEKSLPQDKLEDMLLENVTLERNKVLSREEEVNLNKAFWHSVIRQAHLMGLLQKEHEEENDLIKLTKKGKAFLVHPHPLPWVADRNYQEEEQQLLEEKEKKTIVDSALLQQLQWLRIKEASKRKVAPYLIFKDDMLEEMATYYPDGLQQLTNIYGISCYKAEKFGEPFVQLIASYKQQHNITSPPDAPPPKTHSLKLSKKFKLIQQIDRKMELHQMAENYGMEYLTLIKELEKLIQSGIRLNINYYLDKLLDKPTQDYLYAHFHQREKDDIDNSISILKEEDFEEDEVRLMHIKFLSEVAN